MASEMVSNIGRAMQSRGWNAVRFDHIGDRHVKQRVLLSQAQRNEIEEARIVIAAAPSDADTPHRQQKNQEFGIWGLRALAAPITECAADAPIGAQNQNPVFEWKS